MSSDHDTPSPEAEIENPGSFAVRLFHARGAYPPAGLTQEQLAERAGLQQSTIAHYEAGRREPNLGNLRRLVWATGQSADYLLATRPGVDDCYREPAFEALPEGLPPPKAKPAQVGLGELWRLREIHADVVPSSVDGDLVTFEIEGREFTASARRMLTGSSWTFHGRAE